MSVVIMIGISSAIGLPLISHGQTEIESPTPAQETTDQEPAAPETTSDEESTEEVTKSEPSEQEGSDDSNNRSNAQAGIERVEVTGSRIKRIDIEGPSPVFVLDEQDLQRTGYNSVADVLRDTTVNSFGSTREQSGSNASGVAHVNLRGLGAGRTLVLLNGQRMPADGVTGAVDLNLIPMAAVERIEILKDGASALYGSDALGGVVNVVTKKDFDGAEVSVRQVVPELDGGGDKLEASFTHGFNTSKFNMVNVLYFRDNERIYARDREWSAEGVSTTGSPGSYRQVNADGSVGPWLADPNCPSSSKRSTPAGEDCTYNFAKHATLLPDLRQFSYLNEMNYQATSTLSMRLRLNATQKDSMWVYAPSPGTFEIPSSVADGYALPGVTSGSDVRARYRLLELGDRVSETKTTAYGAQAGVKNLFGETWEWEFLTSYHRVQREDRGISGYALTADLDALIASGDFNPFGTPGSRGSLASAAYVPTENVSSEVFAGELKASGEIYEMAAGPLGLALGTQYTQESYQDKFDERSKNNEVFGNAGSDGEGGRQTTSLYSELGIPLATWWELQLAGRYDNFSDFGETVNPKIATRMQLSPSWLVRASAGTGFKAPLLQDLYQASSLGYPTFIDQVACDAEKAAGGATPSCEPAQYLVTSSGNKGLQEEKSISVNLGTQYQPSPDFNAGFDLWQVKMNNVVGISYDDLTKAEAQGIDVSKYGVIVTRDSNGYIESIEAPLQNLSSRDVIGIDLHLEKHKRTSFGSFGMTVEHSHIFHYKQEGFPGTGFEDILGDNGLPPWRNNVTLLYSPGTRHRGSLTARTVAGHKKAVEEDGELDPYTELDLQYNYSAGWGGTITAGVKNLLGSTPPLDDSNPNRKLDSTIYDQLGRQFYIGYRHSF